MNRFISEKWPQEMKQMVASMSDNEYKDWVQTLSDAISDRDIKEELSEKTKKAIREMSQEDYQKFKKEFDTKKITEESVVNWLKFNQTPTDEEIKAIVNLL